jgi:hypothetical protein
VEFLNPALFGWLAVGSIPVVIHLLNRRRFRVVRWAAMDFLLQAERQNRRRVRIEHLLILLLRILAMLLLALMVLRPLSSSAGLAILPGVVDPVERVVVLDDSGSMAHRSGRTSSFERAKLALKKLVQDLRTTRPRDYLTVLRVSRAQSADLTLAAPSDEATEAYLRGLEDLVPSQRVFDAPKVLEHALSRVSKESSSRRLVIYVLTDMRVRDWVGPSGELPKQIADVVRRAPERSRVVVVDVGSDDTRNVGIVSFKPTEKLAQVGVPLELEIRVHNYGEAAVADVPLSLESGVGRLPISPVPAIAPGEDVVVRHRYTFPAPGPAALRVRLPEDALPMDDARQLAVNVEEELRVLLVDGEESPQPLKSETDMLRLALAPPGDQTWGVEPVVISQGSLKDQDLSGFPSVILCNLDRLPPSKLGDLEGFVERGGGLAVFLGDRVDVEEYDRTLFKGGEGLLPSALGQRIRFEDEDDAPMVSPPIEPHPLTQIFSGGSNPFLKHVRAKGYMSLPFDPAKSTGAKVLLNLDDTTQTPFAISKPHGLGTVILFNTTADLGWSTWPRDASFPIVALELTRLLAPSSTEGRNLSCGETLEHLINPGRVATVAQLRVPGEQIPRDLHAEPVEDSKKLAFRFPETGRAGVYALLLRTQAGDAFEEHVAVNVDPTEGDLRRVDPVRIRPAFEGTNVDFVRPEDGEALLALTDGEQSELWRTCLYLLVLFLLLEQVLAWRAARHRPLAPPVGGTP